MIRILITNLCAFYYKLENLFERFNHTVFKCFFNHKNKKDKKCLNG